MILEACFLVCFTQGLDNCSYTILVHEIIDSSTVDVVYRGVIDYRLESREQVVKKQISCILFPYQCVLLHSNLHFIPWERRVFETAVA